MPRRQVYDLDLLDVAVDMLRQPAGRRRKLYAARARRSISTAYYALFHFILDEATRALLGTHNDVRARRRTLARVFTRAGIKKALDKIKGPTVEPGVRDLLRPRLTSDQAFAAPEFARSLASTFSEMQVKRHEADYDLNATIGPADANIVIGRIVVAIADWRAADSDDDRDFKHALFLLMLLKGELRRES